MHIDKAKRVVEIKHTGDKPIEYETPCIPARHVVNKPIREGARCQCGETIAHRIDEDHAQALRVVWIAGRTQGWLRDEGGNKIARAWSVIGLCASELEAVMLCERKDDFVGSIPVGGRNTAPDDRWTIYYPLRYVDGSSRRPEGEDRIDVADGYEVLDEHRASDLVRLEADRGRSE